MSRLYSIKEICAQTGLTRKVINTYGPGKNNLNVVLPSGYSNIGFDDKSGYKLYDDIALMKFQQISIFRKLGMDRAEIKKMMTARDYDCNELLNNQIDMLKDKLKELQDTITFAEQLKIIGMKNSMIKYFSKSSIAKLAERNERWINSDYYKKFEELHDKDTTEFDKDTTLFLRKFDLLDKSDYTNEETYQLMQEEFDLYTTHLGFFGVIYLLVYIIIGRSDGTLINDIYPDEIDKSDIVFMSNALITYVRRRYDEYTDQLIKLVVKNHEIIMYDYDDSRVVDLLEQVLLLYKEYFGIMNKEDLRFVVEFMPELFISDYFLLKRLYNFIIHYSEV